MQEKIRQMSEDELYELMISEVKKLANPVQSEVEAVEALGYDPHAVIVKDNNNKDSISDDCYDNDSIDHGTNDSDYESTLEDENDIDINNSAPRDWFSFQSLLLGKLYKAIELSDSEQYSQLVSEADQIIKQAEEKLGATECEYFHKLKNQVLAEGVDSISSSNSDDSDDEEFENDPLSSSKDDITPNENFKGVLMELTERISDDDFGQDNIERSMRILESAEKNKSKRAAERKAELENDNAASVLVEIKNRFDGLNRLNMHKKIDELEKRQETTKQQHLRQMNSTMEHSDHGLNENNKASNESTDANESAPVCESNYNDDDMGEFVLVSNDSEYEKSLNYAALWKSVSTTMDLAKNVQESAPKDIFHKNLFLLIGLKMMVDKEYESSWMSVDNRVVGIRKYFEQRNFPHHYNAEKAAEDISNIAQLLNDTQPSFWQKRLGRNLSCVEKVSVLSSIGTFTNHNNADFNNNQKNTQINNNGR